MRLDKPKPVFNKPDDGGRDAPYNEYLKGSQQILDESKGEKEPYRVTLGKQKFIVLPNVFSPKYFKETELFAEQLPVKEGEHLLEIGPGTGALSVTAALKGAGRVVAIDINPDAVRNTKANIDLHHLQERVEVRQGDVYDALQVGEKFDTIFWNTPFGLVDVAEVPDLEKAIFDPGYRSTERFIREAKQHLKNNGRLLIGFSSTLGRMDLLKKFCNESGFNLKLLYEADSEEVRPVKFEIFEAVQNEKAE